MLLGLPLRHALYAGLSTADHLRLGARLNPGWDDALAKARIARLGLDPARRAGKLSGGQRAQLALTLGVAKRPELLILDEPVAALDPLARREFLQGLMEAAAEQELSVVLSSHLVSDLERACDYLVVLVDSRVRVAGEADDYSTGLAACTKTTDGCTTFLDRFFQSNQTPFLAVTAVVLLLPALVGLFWGAPLITRELEADTHRLVWNQSVTRTRWLAAKLGVTGLGGMTAAGLAALAVTWWAGPVDKAAATHIFPRMGPLVFAARGVVPIGYAAFAFTLGVAVGMLVRRTLPAMAITLAVFLALQIAMPVLVRPHLFTPTRTSVELSESNVDGLTRHTQNGPLYVTVKEQAPDQGAWVLDSELVDASGHTVTGSVSVSTTTGPCAPGQADGKGGPGACFAELNRLGYRQQVTYHASKRFWAFQWAETGIYLGLAACLAGGSFWWIRRRI